MSSGGAPPKSVPATDTKANVARVREFLKVIATGSSAKSRLDALNKVVHLSTESVVRELRFAEILAAVRVTLVNPQRSLRAASLRAVRYFMRSAADLNEALQTGIAFFAARSMERTKEFEQERMQAMKLIRKIMEIDASLVPRSLVCSLVAIADSPDDNFRKLSLEALVEITIRNTELVAHCGGIKTLFGAILDTSTNQEIGDSLTLTLLFLLNEAETRAYIRQSLDLGLLLSPFTETYSYDASRMGAATKAVTTMMKTWVGVIAFTGDPYGLRTLVQALKLPSRDIQTAILSIIYEVFRVPDPKAKNRKTVDLMAAFALSGGGLPPSRTRGYHNILNNFFSAVLLAFIHAGLFEVLVEMGTHSDRSVARSATILLGELLALAANVLPAVTTARLQSLPTLVNTAASFARADEEVRVRASRMVNDLREIAGTRSTYSTVEEYRAMQLLSSSQYGRRDYGGNRRKRDRIEALKVSIDRLMDDNTFSKAMSNSKVMAHKDYQKWNWDVINDLLEGPLTQSNRLEKALGKKGFIARLLGFYRPDKRLFVTLNLSTSNTIGSNRYVETGKTLLALLLSSKAGQEFLITSGFIADLGEILRIETKSHPELEASRVLSPERVAKTLAREYFALLGTITSFTKGLELIEKVQIFTYLFHIVQLPTREDLTKLIITSLDYNVEGSSRILLIKTLRSPSKFVRYTATEHLKTLLRDGTVGFTSWGIQILVKQLEDSEPEVSSLALRILDEACDEPANLESFIAQKPSVAPLTKFGKNLLLRVLSSSNGFR